MFKSFKITDQSSGATLDDIKEILILISLQLFSILEDEEDEEEEGEVDDEKRESLQSRPGFSIIDHEIRIRRLERAVEKLKNQG